MHFEVSGGNSLKGTIEPQGAKNEALQVISAVLLTRETVIISNVPDILDVNLLISLLESLGVEVIKISAGEYSFTAKNINLDYLLSEDFSIKSGHLRGSVMIAGPLLARYNKAVIPQPGGDKIGRRRLDTHILGFQKLGIEFNIKPNKYFELKGRIKGDYILLDEPSVTGTANLIMAASLGEGTTTIYNAACEPYIQQLCKMLNSMGAQISGVGSNLLTIKGVDKLSGAKHRILPDMIEIGSFIGMAAMTRGELLIKNAGVKHLGIIPDKFRQLGINLEIKGDDIFVPSQEVYEVQTHLDGSVLTIYDHPWPGFTPDLLSIVLVVAIQAKGSVLIHQKMFESRLFFVDKL